MSTSKHFDKICCIVLCFTVLVTVLFMNGNRLGVLAASNTMGYENRLFDTSKVHTIDIVMDNWDEFIDTCTNEEYSVCTVIIDGEAYKNVGIRAKGNTSLSSVASYGNDRYSFKIEFDQYDDTKSYYGLDKLSLNNIIQDNTYMKDYLVYQMMGEFGVAAPLCSYAYITVNGEDFGLYLAIEAVEDGFLTRNYGSNYGDLYKPDSMSMGGGRGNGKDFDKEDMEDMFGNFEDMQMPDISQFGGGMQMPDMSQFGGDMQMPDMSQFGGGMQMPDMSQFGGGMNFPGMSTDSDTSSDTESSESKRDKNSFSFDFGGMGGFGGFGGSDVSLVYSNDNYDSYSNIFGNAKTTVNNADKDRLIASLQQLNEGTDIESVVNIEEVIRYFVVHNFAVNFDSYTGSMIHNYYLYEKDGKFEMIPWDYNLAFGTFQGSSDATSLVNYPIDTPVSGGSVESRPMIAWIFEDEEYTELYHEYFAEFLAMYYDNGALEEMIDSASKMIAPYIEKQPTEFCTYEEFELGVATLKEFCSLRCESIAGQLNGRIPSTSNGQSADKSALVDGSGLTVSAMGSFGGGGGFGGFGGGKDSSRGSKTTEDTTYNNLSYKSTTQDTSSFPSKGNMQRPDMSQFGDGNSFPDMGNMQMPDMSQSGDGSSFPDMGNMQMPDMSQFGEGSSFPGMWGDNSATDADSSTEADQSSDSSTTQTSGSRPSGFDRNSMYGGTASNSTQTTTLILLGVSVVVLAGGLAFAILYGRKKH